MGTAAELRKQIESALAGRIPAALSPRPLRSLEFVSCGVAEVDALLGGGLPLGAIVEFTPPQHATRSAGTPVGTGAGGHTTLALSTLAGLTRSGHCCAYVDACDTLDPLSAAALGVELRRLLWVRPPEENFVERKNKDQRSAPRSDSYQRLERALRATDLLLNAGGWGAVVLDLRELPAAQARRVPLATWYRFRLQAEKSRTLLLLLTPVACANSCAAVSLHSEETQAAWRQAAAGVPGAPSFGVLGRENDSGTPLHPGKPTTGLLGTLLLAELHHRVSVSRNRGMDAVPKKPPASHPASANGRPVQGAEQTWWASTLSYFG